MKQTAIITGASRGIGAAIALELTKHGIHAFLLARELARLNKVAELIQAQGGDCTCYHCDVSNAAEINALINLIEGELTDTQLIMINNAGFGGPFHLTTQVSEEEWDLAFATNVKAPFLFCKRLLPLMKANNYGRIINIASIYGSFGGAFSSTYSASKHALVGYSKSIAVEWGKWNITCNVISPGYMDAGMGIASVESGYSKVINQIPSHRLGLPEEVAQLVAQLIQPGSSYINGADIMVDGGLTAGFH